MRKVSGIAVFVLSTIIIIGCGDPEEQAVAPSADETARTETARAEVSQSGTRTQDESCPPLGDLTETFDASGTPLVFDFRHPAGFEVQKNEMVGDSMYQVDLRKSVDIDGRPRQVVISIIQGVKPGDDAIPVVMKAVLDMPENPAIAAMSDMLPKSGGEVSYGGQTVPVFRMESEDKAVYHFNLPGVDGYYTVNVHFVPTHGATMCSERLKELGAEWVQELSPSSE